MKGTFTARENLHLTLNFIGETNRLDNIKKAMNQAVIKSGTNHFMLTIGGFGRFKRRDGDICWVGVEKETSLWRLQQQLVKELEAEGFRLEDREYKPHLTLGRRVISGDTFSTMLMEEAIQPMSMEVSKISLMNSEQLQGKLTYTEIYTVELNQIQDI